MDPFTPLNPEPPKVYTSWAITEDAKNMLIPLFVAVSGILLSEAGKTMTPYD